MAYLDFAAIKDRVKIEEVASWFGFQLTKEQNTLRGCCLICGGSNKREFVITPSKQMYHCFSCSKGGDCISLYANIEGIGVKEAAAAMLARLDTPKVSANTGQLKPLDYLQHAHETVQLLGIPEELAKRVGIGWAGKGTMSGKVCIPVRDPQGVLLFYIGYKEGQPLKLPKHL